MFQRCLLLLMLGLLSQRSLALYDDKPNAELSMLQGEWQGELDYLDYSGSGKRVILPTGVFVALATPSRLVLHYVFDDGPGKTVYSYEQMSFDFTRNLLRWQTSSAANSLERFHIVSSQREGGRWKLVFANESKKDPHRYTLEAGADDLLFQKEELRVGQPATLRNVFRLHRARSGVSRTTGEQPPNKP